MSIQLLRAAIQPISPAYRGGIDSKLFTGFLSYNEGQVIGKRGGSRKRRPADPVRDQELATGHDCDASRQSPEKLSTSRLLPVAFPTPYNPPGEIPGDHPGFRIDIWL